jgi:RNA polymerase sigma-70 factor, ECF subfamily
MTGHETAELIERAAQGEAAAFARLCESHYMAVYKMAYKWCGKREDAEDIAQDVFVKLPEKLASFRGDAAFTSWLYRLTINSAKDYYRTTGKAATRELPFTEGFDAPSDEVPADEQIASRQAFAAVHALPSDMRDAVLLVYGEDMNHKQAAVVLGCAEATVSWRIFQARKKLKITRERYAG